MAGGIEFDWDDENTTHLAAHKVKPAEFERVMKNDPLDLDYEVIDGEERYRSVGLTKWRPVTVGGVYCAQWQVTRRNCVSS